MQRKVKRNIMRSFVQILLVLSLSLAAQAEEPKIPNTENTGRWSVEKANEWYAKQPWPCGFNYIPANAISYTEMWMPSPGHSMVRNPKTWPRLEKYVTDILGSFKDDPRVWVWDIYNEPTNGGLGDTSLPLLTKVFAWARAIGPSQPLTVGQWNGNKKLNAIVYENSDIITFHNYGGSGGLANHIKSLKNHGRPMINTEWLNRGRGSIVKTCLPVFKRENVGCMHWGLVNGKTQTNLGWGWRPGMAEPKVWQHDLYHGDHTPYDEKELTLFRKYTGLSKEQ